MEIVNAGRRVQSDRNQEERSGQQAGKDSSTAQRRTLHSRVRGAGVTAQSYGDARDGVNARLWRWFMDRSRAAEHSSREWPQPDVRAVFSRVAIG
jgi:hypothetical protein